MLFENLNRLDPVITIKIIFYFKEYSVKEGEDKLDLILNPIYFDDNPIRVFDGSTADNICGIGIYLKLSTKHTVKTHFVRGIGNNMKAEIMGLWGIIFLSSYLSIKKLMVVGDSKVTIDWINDKSNLNIIYLGKTKSED
jgi:hypothetical protein